MYRSILESTGSGHGALTSWLDQLSAKGSSDLAGLRYLSQTMVNPWSH
jgi:hypothetical protein